MARNINTYSPFLQKSQVSNAVLEKNVNISSVCPKDRYFSYCLEILTVHGALIKFENFSKYARDTI